MSLARTIKNIRQVGLKQWFRDMTYIGDAKAGRLVGQDAMGNKYYENLNPHDEVPGRGRWIEYSQDDFNASQATPEWHSWLHGIRHLPPTEDPIVQQSRPPWLASYKENLTGTRAAYKPYSTTPPKLQAWDPVARPRGQEAKP
ncbi:NADH dehydrogenase (ubiquinone) 1 alpha subcomplex 12 [Tremella mesenterica]|uniref:NADH dehydrogenase [ubiquinone] 1 alpha subcomplex subunit n=1 Tax=Tremella mesenterica TaxID=5217 RepID=A0A4Q1BSZ2_TREME|nr:uncharacterized protein TREMEDRAFT_40436 [Tremella mesenterica DSM 1558]EIW67271.1 hypothetical protein TREMEDRAFT_40436 [Tremella mesenterica DSM 1558]RXK41174.1 NADH dehydrogenase (ubiquinone) 1 alpha subcomplex 12 [Tremella mesenterica]